MKLNRQSRAARRSRRGGFTLIEVMLVLIILVVLGGVSFFAYRSIQQNASKRTAKVQIESFKGGVDLYLQEFNNYPPALEALWDPTIDANNTRRAADQLFIEPTVNEDPWGSPYQMQAPGTHAEIDIWSLGPDGASGTADDIVSWQ